MAEQCLVAMAMFSKHAVTCRAVCYSQCVSFSAPAVHSRRINNVRRRVIMTRMLYSRTTLSSCGCFQTTHTHTHSQTSTLLVTLL